MNEPTSTIDFPTVNDLFKIETRDSKESSCKSKPPKTFLRNDYGLLEGMEYKFREDSTVDWKQMVDPKFLYLNPDMGRRNRLETKYGKKFDEIKPIEDRVDDVDLVISLGGLKSLLRLRGYDSVFYTIGESNQSYASVRCSIDFIANYESEGRAIGYTDCACAHMDNANGFGKSYLLETATNRSFARCIRNFLNINIVSQEELGGAVPDTTESTKEMPYKILKTVMEANKVSWDKIRQKLVDEKVDGSEDFKSINDIPLFKVLEMTARIEKAAKKS